MINDNTILSSFDDKPTLLEWLKKVEDALKSDTATAVSVENPTANTYVFKITFADGTNLSSGNVVFPDSVKDVSIKNGHIIVTSVGGNVEDLGVLNPYAGTIVVNAETDTTEIGNNVSISGNVGMGGNLGVTGQAVVGGRLQVNSSIISNGEIRGGNISGTKFLLGTEEMPLVKANPAGEATETLEKVKIGDVAYNVGGGGGGITKRTLTIPKSELSLGGDLTEDGKHKALVLSETARANFVSFIEGSSVDECAFVKIIIKSNTEISEGLPFNIALNLNKSVTDYGLSYIGANVDTVTLYTPAFYIFANDTFDKDVAFFEKSESYFDGMFNRITELEIIEYIM